MHFQKRANEMGKGNIQHVESSMVNVNTTIECCVIISL